MTGMRISPVVVERTIQPVEYASPPRGGTTEPSAQICAGIVTNLAPDVLHPKTELRDWINQ
jgi:hypothetical protein